MANEYAVNHSDLKQVADAIRTKGETSGQLVFPSGFVSAIQSIQVGVTVQKTSGTFTTASDGTATVDCGFQPDFLVIHKGETYNGACFSAAFAFEEYRVEDWVDSALYLTDDDAWYLLDIYAKPLTNGFEVEISGMDTAFEFTPAPRETLNYVAIKYT